MGAAASGDVRRPVRLGSFQVLFLPVLATGTTLTMLYTGQLL
ncbi:hypothetical protein [Streptomyces sp. MB09-02B]|nr:hypothetical protein [Streptomyces sp. MB09-02B]MDX3638607.1 hypothetical protein [Streptomyces sp. MB09-02B]